MDGFDVGPSDLGQVLAKRLAETDSKNFVVADDGIATVRLTTRQRTNLPRHGDTPERELPRACAGGRTQNLGV